jgi:hypothetical protein
MAALTHIKGEMAQFRWFHAMADDLGYRYV